MRTHQTRLSGSELTVIYFSTTYERVARHYYEHSPEKQLPTRQKTHISLKVCLREYVIKPNGR
jgi:hypothetical protein